MSTRRDSADGPEDIDAAFAEIVAGLERDAPLARWPSDDDADSTTDETPTPDRPAGTPVGQPESGGSPSEPPGPRDWTPPSPSPSPAPEDEGHYEPPEPPPLPTPRATTVGGIAVIGIGVVLLLVPGLAGLGSTVALPLGLVAISAGISWLLFRIRRNPPDSGGDGAQL